MEIMTPDEIAEALNALSVNDSIRIVCEGARMFFGTISEKNTNGDTEKLTIVKMRLGDLLKRDLRTKGKKWFYVPDGTSGKLEVKSFMLWN